jgi:hypothetical protein
MSQRDRPTIAGRFAAKRERGVCGEPCRTRTYETFTTGQSLGTTYPTPVSRVVLRGASGRRIAPPGLSGPLRSRTIPLEPEGLPCSWLLADVIDVRLESIEQPHSRRAELSTRGPLGGLRTTVARRCEIAQGVADSQSGVPIAQKLEGARLSAFHYVIVQFGKPAVLRQRRGSAEDQRRSNCGYRPLLRHPAHRTPASAEETGPARKRPPRDGSVLSAATGATSG